MRNQGFTLVELMVSTAILSLVAAIGFYAVQAAANSVAIANAKSEVQRDLRDVLSAMEREVQLASKTPDDSFDPPLEAVAVSNGESQGEEGAPIEVRFQLPIDGSGRHWTDVIRYRLFNEDVNGNGRLDDGEDMDEDGVLSRRVLRLEDRNDDGDIADAEDQVILAGANTITNAQFTLNGDVLTVVLTGSKNVNGNTEQTVTMTKQTNIYLLN